MKKKILSIVLAAAMTMSLAACGSSAEKAEAPAAEAPATEAAANDAAPAAPADFKVGIIYIGDENEGYTESHMIGIDGMMAELGLSEDQVIEKTLIPEGEACYEAAADLADQGCNVIFANSFGHESYMMQAAQEYPDVQFFHATGYQAAGSGLSNFHNYFTKIYEARYVAGVVAGMKLNEMIENGTITEETAKMGYVGAYPYAEVVSGFTSFYLGAKSVCPSVTMEVQYTNSWADMAGEKETATKLIADGCVLISQHADTTGAPSACEDAGVPVVGYNVSMIAVAPNTALTSATNVWAPYYTMAVKAVMNGESVATDTAEGIAAGCVDITELNDAAIAAGTKEKVAETIEAIKNGSLHVFDVTTFTVDGKQLTEADDEHIADGYYHESEAVSAPSFAYIVDGITDIQ